MLLQQCCFLWCDNWASISLPLRWFLQHVRAVRNGFSLITKLEWRHWPHNTHAPFFKNILNLGQLSLITTSQFLKVVIVQNWKNLSLLRWPCAWMEGNKQKIKLKKMRSSPSWCSSLDWARVYEPNGRWFDSQSGHICGLRARYLVGGTWEATTYWCFFSCRSLSLPLSLKINK